ncbi:MAG: hypothetical protein [Bacteriophage sp.]|nr:MAG: hypothetical protein [Bacteriophage sp.]
MSEDDATRVVNAVGIIFQMIFGFITAPFRAAWKLISSLFDVWGDDSLSFTDKLNKTFDVIKDFLFAPFKVGWEFVKKLFSSFGIDAGKVVGDIGKSFASVFDKIVAPFKRAKSWISDVFGTFVGGIMKKVNKALSLIGMGSKDDGNVEQPNDNGENYKAFMKTLQPVLSIDTSLPAYPQSSTKNTAVNQSMNNNITINTSDTKTGVDQASNFLLEQLKIANNNAKSGLGVN